MCRAIIVFLTVAYLVALFLLAAGTFGWFGQARDPLSGFFLIPLGMPWNLLTGVFPDILQLPLAVLSPALNIAIIAFLCQRFRKPK